MDSGQGYFVTADNQKKLKNLINDYPDHGGIFNIGQTLKVKGSYFKVSKITRKKLTLRLLSKVKGEESQEERMRKLKNNLCEFIFNEETEWKKDFPVTEQGE